MEAGLMKAILFKWKQDSTNDCL